MFHQVENQLIKFSSFLQIINIAWNIYLFTKGDPPLRSALQFFTASLDLCRHIQTIERTFTCAYTKVRFKYKRHHSATSYHKSVFYICHRKTNLLAFYCQTFILLSQWCRHPVTPCRPHCVRVHQARQLLFRKFWKPCETSSLS